MPGKVAIYGGKDGDLYPRREIMITVKDTYASECFAVPVSREGCRAMMDYHLYYYRDDLRRAGIKSGITSLVDHLAKKPSCDLAPEE